MYAHVQNSFIPNSQILGKTLPQVNGRKSLVHPHSGMLLREEEEQAVDTHTLGGPSEWCA